MRKDEEPLLNGLQLAEALGFGKSGPTTVSLMKRAGYTFSHSFKTTASHARDWLKKSGFRPSLAQKLAPLHPNKSVARKKALAGSRDGRLLRNAQPSSLRSSLESLPAGTC